MTIAVTGAAGHFGRHAIASLLARGISPGEIIAVVRNPGGAADLAAEGIVVRAAAYEDAAALREAFAGAERLLFISGSEVGSRVPQHTNIIDAAGAAGVGLIAYTSLLRADSSGLALAEEHRATEALLASSGIDHVLLRNGWYWENYASQFASARSVGHSYGAAGAGLVSAAARNDYAEAAAEVITREGQAGRTYELAGSPALDYPGIASAIGSVIGSTVTYVDLSEEALALAMEEAGTPGPLARMFAGMDTAIAAGALQGDGRELSGLIGRPTTTAATALRALA